MSESPAAMRRYFRYDHLPAKLQRISEPFGLLARWINHSLPDNPQVRLGLQKLVEAKDCIVRGCLDHQAEVSGFCDTLPGTGGAGTPQDG